MTDIVAPRPIAWVSTVDEQGRGNLAPFSYFQAVCSAPATVVLGLAWKPDGTMKDTLANILQLREFTVNHVSLSLAEKMLSTSAPFDHEICEWEACEVEMEPPACVRAPRVAAALAGFECRLSHAIPLGRTKYGTPSSTLVIAHVDHVFVDSALHQRDSAGRLLSIPAEKLASLGRLGADSYTSTIAAFEMKRPGGK